MTNNVHYFDDISKKLQRGTQPPDNGDMDARLSALEARIDTALPTLATKADISDVRGDIQRSLGETHKWMIGTVIGLFIGFGGMFLAMSNALKPSAPVQQAPIVIQVPAGPATPPPAK